VLLVKLIILRFDRIISFVVLKEKMKKSKQNLNAKSKKVLNAKQDLFTIVSIKAKEFLTNSAIIERIFAIS
jgi:hypothetical protein